MQLPAGGSRRQLTTEVIHEIGYAIARGRASRIRMEKVGRWYQKKAAEQAVRHLWGVTGMTNDIETRMQMRAKWLR